MACAAYPDLFEEDLLLARALEQLRINPIPATWDDPAEVAPALVAQARACLLAAPLLPVYVRVDGVVKDERFLLMELEVFEPLMFLASHPEAPGRFARAVHGRLLAERTRMTPGVIETLISKS